MNVRYLIAAAAIFSAGLMASQAQAQAPTNLALNAPVTSTDYYNQGGGETFPASNITDGRLGDTGSAGDWSFWLTPNGSVGTATIDLGSSYNISSFYIQNTLNRGYRDRETDGLNVYVGSSPTTFGDTASYGTLVQTINFADTEGTGVIADDAFAITPTVGQYITVDVTSFYANGGGLNEVEAFGSPVAVSAAPEPSSWALMIAGVGVMGAALRLGRRREDMGATAA